MEKCIRSRFFLYYGSSLTYEFGPVLRNTINLNENPILGSSFYFLLLIQKEEDENHHLHRGVVKEKKVITRGMSVQTAAGALRSEKAFFSLLSNTKKWEVFKDLT